MLRVADLTKQYGRLTALSEVSFSIRPGEVLGLIGPNGSGKTTLFECLGGVLPADRGSIVDSGRVLSSSDRAATMFYLPDGIAPWPRGSAGRSSSSSDILGSDLDCRQRRLFRATLIAWCRRRAKIEI